MSAIFHSRSDMSLTKVRDNRRSVLLSGAVQESDQFSNIFSDRSYIHVTLDVRCEYEAQ